MRKAIINVCTNNGGYPEAQQRLSGTVRGCDFYGFPGEHHVGAPPHNEIPYAFKPFAMQYLKEKGYDLVLWLDASIIVVKPLDIIWQIIEMDGYLMEESGHYLGRWCNDRALRNMNVSRENAMKIPMYSAGVTGLNLNNKTANNFLKDWLKFAKDGETFVGDWSDHRHDMSVASFLAHKYDMRFQSGGTYLSYIGQHYGDPSETSAFHLIGI